MTLPSRHSHTRVLKEDFECFLSLSSECECETQIFGVAARAAFVLPQCNSTCCLAASSGVRGDKRWLAIVAQTGIVITFSSIHSLSPYSIALSNSHYAHAKWDKSPTSNGSGPPKRDADPKAGLDIHWCHTVLTFNSWVILVRARVRIIHRVQNRELDFSGADCFCHRLLLPPPDTL